MTPDAPRGSEMPEQQSPSRIGVGLYSLPVAAKIIHAPIQKIRRWLDPDEGLIDRYFDPEEQTITFIELMELYFINLFRAQGVSLQTIRKAAKAAAAKFSTKYPFAVKRFDTDGRTIFATLIDNERDQAVVEDLRKGQYVFEQILQPFFRKIEYRGTEEAMRYWPLEMTGRVVLDPNRRFGKPIDAETGIPTSVLYRAVQAGDPASKVASWFKVPAEAVEAAVRFETSLSS